MSELDKAFDAVDTGSPLGIYRSEEYLGETDLLVSRLVEAFERSTENERRAVGGRLRKSSSKLQLFARRMATIGVREGELMHLERGIRALAIAGHLMEHADLLTGLALLHTSLKELGSDSRFFLDRESQYALGRIKAVFREFLARPELDRNANQFGYRISRRNGDFEYERL